MTPDQHLKRQDHVQQGQVLSVQGLHSCGGASETTSYPTPSCIHTLHIAGPYAETTEGFQYFLIGALCMEGYPIMLQVKMLKTRGAAEICARLGETLAFFESLESEDFPIYPDQPQARRVHGDRAKEFVTRPFQSTVPTKRSG